MLNPIVPSANIVNAAAIHSSSMGYRSIWVNPGLAIGAALSYTGSRSDERFRARPSRTPSGDVRLGIRPWGGHWNNDPDHHVPIPFTRGVAPSADRLGARGWSYLPAVLTPIG